MKAQARIGVALYASGSPFNREGNFACMYRGEPFEFSSASDLPSQTVWITNAKLGDLIDAGLHRNPKIAHDGYFRTRLLQLGQELGLATMPMEKQAALLAELLGNAAEMARLQLGLTQYPTTGIANAVGELYGLSEPPQSTAELQVAEQACQRYVACERERRWEKADVFSFWFPRYQWAAGLMSSPVPVTGGLKLIPLDRLPANGCDPSLLVEWAKENSLPIFTRIRIKGLEPTIGKLMNYGAGAQHLKKDADHGSYEARNLREWCALPELDGLSQVGDLEILQVAIADGWTRNAVHLHRSKLAGISYSYGLVAENLWVGLTRLPQSSGRAARTLATAWIQAEDRMRCLRVAERAYEIGMEVINYGNGRVTVVCPPSVRALIPKFAREEAMLFPACLDGLDASPAGGPTGYLQVLQHLIQSHDYTRIIQVDASTLKELEGARAA